MKYILNFKEFLAEDFATLGNVSGMGDTIAPTPTFVGSGDAWPSLTNGVWTANGLTGESKKKRSKRKKKVIKED